MIVIITYGFSTLVTVYYILFHNLIIAIVVFNPFDYSLLSVFVLYHQRSHYTFEDNVMLT